MGPGCRQPWGCSARGNLLAPSRVGAPRGPRNHDGTIIPDTVDTMWGTAYVLAVRSNHCLRFWTEEGLEETNPAAMADALARDAWATHAAGEGAKGLRLYEWARIALSSTAAPGFEHWLLIRRSTTRICVRAC